jgi:hypothetical protein
MHEAAAKKGMLTLDEVQEAPIVKGWSVIWDGYIELQLSQSSQAHRPQRQTCAIGNRRPKWE